MTETKIIPFHCADCGAKVFYPRELEGRPHKLDIQPTLDGPWVIVAWRAKVHGDIVTFISFFDPEHDEDEERFREHTCREKEL
jgi:uncharacterized OB-fold protein